MYVFALRRNKKSNRRSVIALEWLALAKMARYRWLDTVASSTDGSRRSGEAAVEEQLS